jgi:hypothetical protein
LLALVRNLQPWFFNVNNYTYQMLQTAEDIRLLNEKINNSASFIDKIHAEI